MLATCTSALEPTEFHGGVQYSLTIRKYSRVLSFIFESKSGSLLAEGR